MVVDNVNGRGCGVPILQNTKMTEYFAEDQAAPREGPEPGALLPFDA